MLNVNSGLKIIFKDRDTPVLTLLVKALDFVDENTTLLIFGITAAVCFSTENGHRLALRALLEEDIRKKEHIAKLATYLKKNENPTLQNASLALINALISAEDVEVLQAALQSIFELGIPKWLESVPTKEGESHSPSFFLLTKPFRFKRYIF